MSAAGGAGGGHSERVKLINEKCKKKSIKLILRTFGKYNRLIDRYNNLFVKQTFIRSKY